MGEDDAKISISAGYFARRRTRHFGADTLVLASTAACRFIYRFAKCVIQAPQRRMPSRRRRRTVLEYGLAAVGHRQYRRQQASASLKIDC